MKTKIIAILKICSPAPSSLVALFPESQQKKVSKELARMLIRREVEIDVKWRLKLSKKEHNV